MISFYGPHSTQRIFVWLLFTCSEIPAATLVTRDGDGTPSTGTIAGSWNNRTNGSNQYMGGVLFMCLKCKVYMVRSIKKAYSNQQLCYETIEIYFYLS